jgi:sn-glycerol 3-phosphate transport system substrate-binding protein
MLRCIALVLGFFCAASCAVAREEVRFWHSLAGTQAKAMERLAARFNASQPQYRVLPSYRGTLEATFARALAAKRSAGAPHVVQIHESLTEDLVAERLIVPLWQVMRDARQPLGEGLLPVVAGAFSDARGRLLALPFTSETPVLFYNRDALRRAHVDPAAPPASWYEMPRALAALSDAGSSCPFTTGPAALLLESMSAWHNQEYVNHDEGFEGGGTRLTFASRLAVRWIAMLSSWQKSGYFVYAGRGEGGQLQAEARFAAGECALLAASSASYPALRARAKFDLGVAPLPYYEDFDDAPQNTLAGGAAFWVLAGRPLKAYRGAARFLAFLARPEVQAEWQRETGYVPLTLAAYDLARRRGYYLKQPGNEVAMRQLAGKAPTEDSRTIRFADQGRVRGIVDEELEAVWSGTKAPLDALNAAVARGNELLSTSRR